MYIRILQFSAQYYFQNLTLCTVRVFNFEGLKFCGKLKHKEFVGTHFQGSAENFIACAVMISWFIFVDSKQPQNP